MNSAMAFDTDRIYDEHWLHWMRPGDQSTGVTSIAGLTEAETLLAKYELQGSVSVLEFGGLQYQ